MTDHPYVTHDYEKNRSLVEAYDAALDTGAAFTAFIQDQGYNPPQRPEVERWELCVIGDDDGREWLAWDAVAVHRAETPYD